MINVCDWIEKMASELAIDTVLVREALDVCAKDFGLEIDEVHLDVYQETERRLRNWYGSSSDW